MPNPQAQVNQIFATMEESITTEPVYDLKTLIAVHEYWEFEVANDLTFDAWLHAHIRKAKAHTKENKQ